MQKPRTEARLAAKKKSRDYVAALINPIYRVLRLIIHN